MSKKEAVPDVPTRLWRENLDRINEHLAKEKFKEVKFRKGKKIIKKTSINEFIELMLDVYETYKESKIQYATKLYDDLAEARGEAVMQAAKTKTQVTLPAKVVMIGSDEL